MSLFDQIWVIWDVFLVILEVLGFCDVLVSEYRLYHLWKMNDKSMKRLTLE